MNRKILYTCLILILGMNVCAQPQKAWYSYFGERFTSPSNIVYDTVNHYIYMAGFTADTVGVATEGVHKSDLHLTVPSLGSDYMPMWKWDFVLAKFDTTGQLIWSTYYGGDSMEIFGGMCIDHSGNIYIMGQTQSYTGIATEDSYMDNLDFELKPNQTINFLTKFNSLGHQEWGTYFPVDTSNTNKVFMTDIHVDVNNEILICGFTGHASELYGTMGTHQPIKDEGVDGVIMKFDAEGNRLWGTYFGGAALDLLIAITTDTDGNIFVFGRTASPVEDPTAFSGLATPGSFEDNDAVLSSWLGSGGYQGSILAKFDPSGNRIWSTHLSETSISAGLKNSLVTDAEGNVYILSVINDTTYLSGPDAFQDSFGGGYNDLFIMKFNGEGDKVWGTLFGGNGVDDSNYSFLGIIKDHKPHVCLSPQKDALYIGGYTESTNLYTSECSRDASAPREGFITKLDLATGHPLWSSYMEDGIAGLTVVSANDGIDTFNKLYMVGVTHTEGLGTIGTHRPEISEHGQGGYISKFIEKIYCADSTLTLTWDEETNELVAEGGYIEYHWYKDGEWIASSSTPIYEDDLTSGMYQVIANDGCQCVYLSNTIQVKSTHISEVVDLQSMKLYPNPVTNQLTIDFQKEISIDYDLLLQIKDVMGRMVFEKGISKGTYQQIQIHLPRIPVGMYFLQLGSYQASFIKQD